MISIPLDHAIFAPCFMSLDMFQCLLVYGLWELLFVSYYCVKIVKILIMLKKKKQMMPNTVIEHYD